MASATIVAFGVGTVWAMLWIWGTMLVENWTRTQTATAYESVAVMRNGEPVIETRSYSDYQNVAYRTLDGESVDGASIGLLSPADLPAPIEQPRFFDMPIGWGQSLGAADFATHRGGWYLIRRADSRGRAYFAGFDEFSKMPIGYLSRQGFSRGLPPIEQWFDVERFSTSYNQMRAGVVSNQGLQVDRKAGVYYGFESDPLNVTKWWIFVLDGDQLRQVDLEARTVREVFAAHDLVSLGMLTESFALPRADETGSTTYSNMYRVVVRSRDHLYVLDPRAHGDGDSPLTESLAKRDFLLPESLRGESLRVYSVVSDQLLAHWQAKDPATGLNMHHLTWLAADGKILREESFHLGHRGGSGPSPLLAATLFGFLAPTPIGWATVVGAIIPVARMNLNQQPTYAAALSELAGEAWPGIIIVLALGALSAWLVWRWQRQYFRPATGAWCTFAFLFGPPGLFAYWLEMHRAKLEPCTECQRTIPRDREACPECDTPYAPPPLVGTEIFA